MTSQLRLRPRALRALRRVSIVSAVATATLALTATAAFANYGGTINTGGGNVNERSGPGTSYTVVGSLPNGASVNVYCVWPNGTPVTGPYGTTSLWDEIGGGKWVSDAFVNTGTSAPIAMPCGGGNGAAFTYGGPEETDVYAEPGCYFVNGGSGTNFGAAVYKSSDWWQYNSGCSASGAYMWTYGNGSSPSGDNATWGYYPGAYAHCYVHVQIPRNDSGGAFTFDQDAHYQVLTNKKQTVLSNQYYNQQNLQNTVISLGPFDVDGTGYIAVRLDDSGTAGSRVVAQLVTFTCTSKF